MAAIRGKVADMREVLRARFLSLGTLLPSLLGPTVLRRISSAPKSIFLTFDDGPGNGTPLLLDFLDDASIPATFFLTGERLADYPDTVGFVGDHHQIGNHFFNHRDPGSCDHRPCGHL